MDMIEKLPSGASFDDALAYLARCQSWYNELGRIVSTKDPDSLRCACDEEMRRRYELHGQKSVEVRIGGETVATYTVAKTKEQPSRKVRWFSIGRDAALGWLLHDAPETCRDELLSTARRIAERYMQETGELIDGAKTGESVEPAVPSRFKNTVLKVDAEKIAGLAPAETRGELA